MADTKEIVFVNYILDTVHGFIGLTAIENKIERLPIFKRLQDISQLGLVKRIFPGAVHNRYTHSLGVMHVIDQMALHLGKYSTFTAAERQMLRLAGMLHDLGHYPLSHDLEQVYDKDNTITSPDFSNVNRTFIDETSKTLQALGISEDGSLQTVLQKPKKELVVKGHYHHETVTSRVIRASKSIRNIIKDGIKAGAFDDENHTWKPGTSTDADADYLANQILNDICALIQGNGDYDYNEGAFPDHFTAFLQMLHSELDADRIDYLLRDATFSGASYGTFDLGVLLQNLAMKRCENGDWIVGVQEKGIGCADQYMMNRYLAYTQVIFHKYTSIIGKMLREVVTWMMYNDSGFDFYSPQAVDKIIQSHEKNTAYLSFTDNYFFEKLNQIEKEKHGCPESIFMMVQQLWKYRSLDVKKEDIFAGDSEHQQKHLAESEIFRDLRAQQPGQEEKDTLFLLDRKKITNHLPYPEFKEKFDAYNKMHSGELDFRKFERDRLIDGLAVISQSGEPYLLIDAPRSMMTELYGLQQTMLREYILETPK